MGNPSDIIGLCLLLVTWSAPVAIPIFRLKRRKPFVLYVVASFWQGRRVPRTRKPGGKWIIAGSFCLGDIARAGLLLPSRGGLIADVLAREKTHLTKGTGSAVP